MKKKMNKDVMMMIMMKIKNKSEMQKCSMKNNPHTKP